MLSPAPPTATLLQGDCIAVMALMPEKSVDLIVTDPPYGQTSLPWDRVVSGWQAAALRILKPSGSLWCFGSLRHFMQHADDFAGWKMSHDVVWEKHNGTGLFNDRFRNVHEQAAHFYPATSKWSDIFKQPQYSLDATARVVRKKQRPAHWIGATGSTTYESQDGGPRLMRSVIYARSEHGRAVHPTQKPLDFVDLLLRYACPVGGLVFDPFAGSGTTLLAARNAGMRSFGVELNPEYAAIALKRMSGE